MQKTLFRLVIIFSIIASLNCERPDCMNTNPVFENNTPDSKVYKNELAKQLDSIDQTKLTYWLQDFEEKDGIESLYFYVQSDDICAILHLTVNDWGKLERVRETKGVGRFNAEFTKLEFETRIDSISTEFIYKSFDRIID